MAPRSAGRDRYSQNRNKVFTMIQYSGIYTCSRIRAVSTSTAASTSPPNAIAVVTTACLGLASAMGIGRFAFTPLLPLMQQRGQIDLVQGAWLAAANYLGYLLGALACARWHLPPTSAARIGLLGVAVFTLGMGIGGGFEGWLVWRLMAGAASALVLIGLSAWALQALATARRSTWAGGVFAGVGTGIATVGLFSLEAVRFNPSPQQIWRVLGVAAAIVSLLAWPQLTPASGALTQAAPPRRQAAFDTQAWRMIVAYGSFGFGYILPATFLPAMARQYFSEPSQFGLVWP